jgi:hypothetical protein
VGRASYKFSQDLTAFPTVKFRKRPGSILLYFSLLSERGGEGGMFLNFRFRTLYGFVDEDAFTRYDHHKRHLSADAVCHCRAMIWCLAILPGMDQRA